MDKTIIKLDKIYRSEKIENAPNIRYDKLCIKRPSWINVVLDKDIIFIKIIFNEESFWYRRYFKDYFFPLENTSEDYKNYYDEIAENYESYVPQNKKIGKIILDLFDELKISKDSKVLDFGAGTGLVTGQVALAGYKDISLIDISKNEIEIAKRKKALKNSKFKVMDVTKQDIHGEFDVIFETMSIDYFKGEQMTQVLTKISKALNNKGKFILVDRHIYTEFNKVFKEVKSGKITLETPEGNFDYYYYIGEKI